MKRERRAQFRKKTYKIATQYNVHFLWIVYCCVHEKRYKIRSPRFILHTVFGTISAFDNNWQSAWLNGKSIDQIILIAIGICSYSFDFICYALIGFHSIKSESYIRTELLASFISNIFPIVTNTAFVNAREWESDGGRWYDCFVLNKSIHTICNIKFSWKSNIILLWLHLVALYFSPYFNSHTFANNAHFLHIMCSTHIHNISNV